MEGNTRMEARPLSEKRHLSERELFCAASAAGFPSVANSRLQTAGSASE